MLAEESRFLPVSAENYSTGKVGKWSRLWDGSLQTQVHALASRSPRIFQHDAILLDLDLAVCPEHLQ